VWTGQDVRLGRSYLLLDKVLSSNNLSFVSVWIWETFLNGTIGGASDNDFECVAVLSGHEGDVKCVQFASSHGQWGDGEEILISVGYDDRLVIWAEDAGDWYSAGSLTDLHSDTIWSVSVAPGSGRVLSASGDGSLSILKHYTKAEKKKLFPDEAGRYVSILEHQYPSPQEYTCSREMTSQQRIVEMRRSTR